MGDTRKWQKMACDFECWAATGASGGHFVSGLNIRICFPALFVLRVLMYVREGSL